MGYITIHTNRLVLKDIVLEDSLKMFEYRSDPSIMEFQSFKPTSINDVESFIKNNTLFFNVVNTWFQIGIYYEDTIIGDIGIHFIDPENQQCEIGYTIGKKDQHKGFGKESIQALIDYIFISLKKHRVIASVDPGNTASLRLLKDLGFRNEGYFVKSILIQNEWKDDMVFGVLEEEWVKNKEMKKGIENFEMKE